MLLIVASLVDAARGVIYDRHMFIVQATEANHKYSITSMQCKKLTVNKIFVNDMSVNEMNVYEISIYEMCVHEMMIEEMSVNMFL